ncbi:outer membrane adhesin-like protein [Paucimonas lemoignei]|nr:outer membrane adhesin-like protein [Paucimonas lemoignei]
MATTSAQVQQLYVAYLGRAADKAGLDYWLNELNADTPVLTLENLRANFVTEQAEYADVYGGLSRSDTVIKIYNNLFGRAPDAAGLTYWTTGAGSTVNADQLLTAFVAGASTADAKVVANKVLVAEVYTSTAAENYVKADSVSILTGVTGDASSIAAAVAKLEDGSLSGIAIPAGVGALKAADIAAKAQVDFEASKVAELVALNAKIVALDTKADANADLDALVTPGAGVAQKYADVDQAITNATELRTAISTSTTTVLQADATREASELNTARDAYKVAAVGNVDLANTYEAAVTANAALTAADTAAVGVARDKLTVDFNAAVTADSTALATANTAAGTSVTNVATLYAALTNEDATPAQITAITNAFNTFFGTAGAADFTAVKTLAATDYAKNVAADAEADAAAAITGSAGTTYKNALTEKTTADTTLANAQAADALVAEAKVINDAHNAVVQASDDADTAIPSYVVDVAANAGVAGTNEVFHFAGGVATADDFAINFGAKDALYLGEGYSLNTTATLTSTGIQGGNNSALEVFFFKDATSGNVKAVVETAAEGNTTVTSNALAASTTDKVAIITLTGVTDVAQVSFANGVISHVA